jgi:hypothetical protein
VFLYAFLWNRRRPFWRFRRRYSKRRFGYQLDLKISITTLQVNARTSGLLFSLTMQSWCYRYPCHVRLQGDGDIRSISILNQRSLSRNGAKVIRVERHRDFKEDSFYHMLMCIHKKHITLIQLPILFTLNPLGEMNLRTIFRGDVL